MNTKYVIWTTQLPTPVICTLDVEKDSPHSVWLKLDNGQLARRRRFTEYEEIHDTWDQAHARLLEIIETGVANAQAVIAEYDKLKTIVSAMKPPQS